MATEKLHGATPEPAASAPRQVPSQIGRRRMLLGSLGAGPVVMTVSPKALATNCGVVFTPSQATSANLSGMNQQLYPDGRSPGYWKNHTSEWVGCATSTTFKSVFGSCPSNWATSSTRPTMLDVISPETYGSGGNGCANSTQTAFARACVASYLNAKKGLYTNSSGNWLPATQVVAMYQGGMGTGWTVPGTAVTWNMAQIQQYLINTWDNAKNGCIP